MEENYNSKMRKYYEERNNIIIEMIREGKSREEVAKKFGLSKVTVSGILSDRGIYCERKNKKTSPEQVEKYYKEYLNCFNFTRVASKFKVSISTVKNSLYRIYPDLKNTPKLLIRKLIALNPAKDLKIIELVIKYRSYAKVAKITGLSRQRIHQICKKNNISFPKPKLTIEQKREKQRTYYYNSNKREYYKEYSRRPEVKIRTKKYQEEYRKRPEYIEKKKKYDREYRGRPEVKERAKIHMKVYLQKPEIRERRNKYYRDYYKRPEVKARLKANRLKTNKLQGATL